MKLKPIVLAVSMVCARIGAEWQFKQGLLTAS